MSIPPLPSMRVLIVDDHGIMRAGLRMLFESQPGFTVVGEASTCADALALATETQPDVIVLDLDVGGENAAESMPTLLRTAPDTRILVLTGVHDPRRPPASDPSRGRGVGRKGEGREDHLAGDHEGAGGGGRAGTHDDCPRVRGFAPALSPPSDLCRGHQNCPAHGARARGDHPGRGGAQEQAHCGTFVYQ